MRNVRIAAIVAVLAVIQLGHTAGSEGADDLVKLAKTGVDEDVMLAYIDASPVAYDLTVDEILYFNDLGLSPKIIAAALNHGRDLRAQNAAAPMSSPQLVDSAVSTTEANDPPLPISPPAIAADSPTTPPATAATVEYSDTTVLAPPPDQVNISYFYDSLTPYGKWINIDGTYVWQPNAVIIDSGWRPYCNRGHWVYTDLGWAWQSDYSWGWAPFHYGRWTCQATYGWVWYPDCVWGPAWVSWRNSEVHAGWAPLPPQVTVEAGVGFHFGGKHVSLDIDFGLTQRDYIFVPVEHFCDTAVTTYVVPRTQITEVYNQTTFVQNTVIVENDRVINRGISVDLIAARTHREIKPVTVVDLNVQVGAPIRGTAVTAATFAVYRPKIQNVAQATPEVIAARREEQAKRIAIHQQEMTQKAQIRANNSLARTQSRQKAATTEIQARQNARANEVAKRQDTQAHRIESNSEVRANAAEIRAQNKESRAADTALRETLRRVLSQDNSVVREVDAAAREQAKRDAFARAEADRQAALAQRREIPQDSTFARQADVNAREQARRDAEASAQADVVAREQARRNNLVRAQTYRQDVAPLRRTQNIDGPETRQTEMLTHEQARREIEAKAETDRLTAAQAHSDSELRAATERQTIRDSRATRNLPDTSDLSNNNFWNNRKRRSDD